LQLAQCVTWEKYLEANTVRYYVEIQWQR